MKKLKRPLYIKLKNILPYKIVKLSYTIPIQGNESNLLNIGHGQEWQNKAQ